MPFYDFLRNLLKPPPPLRPADLHLRQLEIFLNHTEVIGSKESARMIACGKRCVTLSAVTRFLTKYLANCEEGFRAGLEWSKITQRPFSFPQSQRSHQILLLEPGLEQAWPAHTTAVVRNLITPIALEQDHDRDKVTKSKESIHG